MMNKILTWIDGFRLKDHEVPLATSANLSTINLNVMGSIFESMTRTIANFTCESASFAILDFKANKVINVPLYYNLIKKKKSISQLKISRCGLDISNKREIFVSATVFCLGLDKQVWRFDFKASTVYTSLRNDIEIQVADVLIDYLNGFIDMMDLNKMCLYDMHIDNTLNYESVHGEIYNGWVKSYCNELEYQNYATILDTSDMSNEANILLHCINEKEMEQELEDESMIIDVIRRRDSSLQLRDDVLLVDVFDRNKNQNISIGEILIEPEYDHKISVAVTEEVINET